MHRQESKMSEKRYIVPEGMLKAVQNALVGYWHDHTVTSDSSITVVLEAAVRWLSENPIVPTEQEYRDFGVKFDFQGVKCIAEWQRRMFLAPEPEVPEAIKDLMCGESVDVKPPVEVGNKDKIVGHGFDLVTSFRGRVK
jgi:hypothetical protein